MGTESRPSKPRARGRKVASAHSADSRSVEYVIGAREYVAASVYCTISQTSFDGAVDLLYGEYLGDRIAYGRSSPVPMTGPEIVVCGPALAAAVIGFADKKTALRIRSIVDARPVTKEESPRGYWLGTWLVQNLGDDAYRWAITLRETFDATSVRAIRRYGRATTAGALVPSYGNTDPKGIIIGYDYLLRTGRKRRFREVFSETEHCEPQEQGGSVFLGKRESDLWHETLQRAINLTDSPEHVYENCDSHWSDILPPVPMWHHAPTAEREIEVRAAIRGMLIDIQEEEARRVRPTKVRAAKQGHT